MTVATWLKIQPLQCGQFWMVPTQTATQCKTCRLHRLLGGYFTQVEKWRTTCTCTVLPSAITYQASLAPPGMSDGPYLAPSSPPLTPLPINHMPFASRALQRRYIVTNNNNMGWLLKDVSPVVFTILERCNLIWGKDRQCFKLTHFST